MRTYKCTNFVEAFALIELLPYIDGFHWAVTSHPFTHEVTVWPCVNAPAGQ